VLEHLANPWTVLSRLRSKLSGDGVLIASIPNVAHYKVVVPLLLHGAWNYTDEGILDRTHLRFFNKKTAICLFEKTGYSVQKILANTSYPNFFGLLGISDANGRWYTRKFLRSLPILPKRLIKFQYFLAARSVEMPCVAANGLADEPTDAENRPSRSAKPIPEIPTLHDCGDVVESQATARRAGTTPVAHDPDGRCLSPA